MDFTDRQWKALVLAYPLYGDYDRCEPVVEESTAPDAQFSELFDDFMEWTVPRVVQAFHLNEEESQRQQQRKGVDHSREDLLPGWRRTVPAEVDGLLCRLFDVPLTVSNVSVQNREESEPDSVSSHFVNASRSATTSQSMAVCVHRSLNAVERQLLRLWYKDRVRSRGYYNHALEQQHCMERAGHALLSCASHFPSATRDETTPTMATMMAHPAARSLSTSHAQSTAAEAATDMYVAEVRSVLARTPFSSSSATAQQRELTLPSSAIAVVCEGCHEEGGELFRCVQCGSVRHEVCGGPHPPDPNSSRDGLCKQCAKDLNLSSSDSSLRSSTSSSERAELDAYFSSDSEDSESSLSGFIVHTSEDDDEEEEEEGVGGEEPNHAGQKANPRRLDEEGGNGTHQHRDEKIRHREGRNERQPGPQEVSDNDSPLSSSPSPSSFSSVSPQRSRSEMKQFGAPVRPRSHTSEVKPNRSERQTKRHPAHPTTLLASTSSSSSSDSDQLEEEEEARSLGLMRSTREAAKSKASSASPSPLRSSTRASAATPASDKVLLSGSAPRRKRPRSPSSRNRERGANEDGDDDDDGSVVSSPISPPPRCSSSVDESHSSASG